MTRTWSNRVHAALDRRATPAGAVDIYGGDADGRTVVVELKQRRVGPDAVGQVDRYVGALERDLHDDTEIRGILVAPSITDRARELLAEKGMEFVASNRRPSRAARSFVARPLAGRQSHFS